MTTKDKVLEALEKDKGSYISGELLAKSCGVSRNAVWKSIKELKESGYSIQSVNNKGYMLEEGSDIISRAGICMYLQEAGWHDKIQVYDEVDSTNNEAKRTLILKDELIQHGTAIIAKRQTAGRGHGERVFSSPDGGIYLTVILDPKKVKSRDKDIAKNIEKAVTRVISTRAADSISRKEDSSLYIGEKKICGILTEGIADLETGIYSNYIAGIGIWPDKIETGQKLSMQKNKIIAELITELEKL
ncbi:MAG: HTH domain-containing protein [Treponema sp.]|nr:HTH domain-containing protein [Treponema sp.]